MARRRKPGRPKGSKNKRKVGRPRTKARASGRKKTAKKRSKATPAQLRALKKARAARAANLKPAKRKKKKATAAQLSNMKKARIARELKNMPKTTRMALKQLHHDMMADTVRGDFMHIPSSAPSILRRVRRHMPTMVSRSN